MCTLVLAGYQEVLGKAGDPQQAFAVVREACYRTSQIPMRLMMRVMLWFIRDPVTWLSRKSLAALSRRQYGASMGFEDEVAPDRATLIVTRCTFHQFFVEHGEPQLTRIICEWDRHWMDVLDASSRPIRTERPTTISTGAERCHFHLIRDTAKAGKGTRDVVLGWVATAPEAKTSEEVQGRSGMTAGGGDPHRTRCLRLMGHGRLPARLAVNHAVWGVCG